MDWSSHFERSDGVCNGLTVFAGTRVPLRTVLASLAEGASVEDIMRSFPTLRPEHVRAAIAFAAQSAAEDIPPTPSPKVPKVA
jgi:uncharacterized protein (DUF433 family)